MKSRATLIGLILSLVAAHSFGAEAKTPPLKLEVYTSPGDLHVNSTIIEGEEDAILVNSQFLMSDAHRVAAMILESGKHLTYVYATHPHPDHYFGNVVMHQAFPEAKLVALPKVVDGIKASWDQRLSFWKGTGRYFAENLPAEHAYPEPLAGNSLTLDGETLKIVGPLQGDSPGDNSYVFIPSIKAIIGGDTLFSGAHVPLGGMKPENRKAWLKVIDGMIKLKPLIVIPGHQAMGAPNDASVLTFMKDYITFFDTALAASKTADELSAKIKDRFPGLAMEGLLQFSSQAAFPATGTEPQ